MSDPAPGFEAVLETALYHEDSEREQMERFYAELLGLPVVARWPDGVALRVGPGVLLLFNRQGLAEREGPIADHGTTGPGHACLTAPRERYEAARQRLEDAGVEILHEHEWGDERRSFYFRDPAGNLIEIADGDLWPAHRSK
jgi:catechol 2,3-dioxygenase-like lactoylglutathione lyase family enzyme